MQQETKSKHSSVYSIQTILQISLKAKSINQVKYANLIQVLEVHVNNMQNAYERFKT
jgi:hypothetical protein